MPKTLRHYQETGINYLTTPRVPNDHLATINTCCRALLSDAPGAGKTLQAITAADLLVPKHHSIVVICPAFLVKQWFNAIADQFPDDSIISFDQQSRKKHFTIKARWYIISVQSLRRKAIYEQMHQLYITSHVDCTIIDESHYIKTPDAIQSKHVRALTKPNFCAHAFLLTATPITKEADDLWHQLHVIDPFKFKAMHEYLNTYCNYTWTSWGAVNVTLKRRALESLQATRINKHTYDLATGYILGRSYADIGLELPPVIPPTDQDRIVKYALPSNRRKAYDDIKYMWSHQIESGEVLTVSSAMELMHMLRRLTNSPEKIQALTNYIDDDPGPYLIATAYKISAHHIQQQLAASHPHLNTVVLTSDVLAARRVQLACEFNRPNDVVIATIPALCEGCDLSHCNTLYFYEEDYTPGKTYQFVSRVRRHRNDTLPNGESPAVTITTDPLTGTSHLHVDEDPNERPIIMRVFHAENTIDERIHRVQNNRAVNIKDLIKVELTS